MVTVKKTIIFAHILAFYSQCDPYIGTQIPSATINSQLNEKKKLSDVITELSV